MSAARPEAAPHLSENDHIPHDVCDKLVVATDENELPRLHDLMERATANGLQGLK